MEGVTKYAALKSSVCDKRGSSLRARSLLLDHDDAMRYAICE
jgi:hypothetical protein